MVKIICFYLHIKEQKYMRKESSAANIYTFHPFSWPKSSDFPVSHEQDGPEWKGGDTRLVHELSENIDIYLQVFTAFGACLGISSNA